MVQSQKSTSVQSSSLQTILTLVEPHFGHSILFPPLNCASFSFLASLWVTPLIRRPGFYAGFLLLLRYLFPLWQSRISLFTSQSQVLLTTFLAHFYSSINITALRGRFELPEAFQVLTRCLRPLGIRFQCRPAGLSSLATQQSGALSLAQPSQLNTNETLVLAVIRLC